MSYADVSYADSYFDSLLHREPWANESLSDRTKALNTATVHIDRLNFRGDKADSDQENEFPRGEDTEVPDDIKIACCEIAYALLVEGKDREMEIENIQVVSQGFANIRNTQNRDYAPEHLVAGIVSSLAWTFLRPYIRDEKSIKLNRVS